MSVSAATLESVKVAISIKQTQSVNLNHKVKILMESQQIKPQCGLVGGAVTDGDKVSQCVDSADAAVKSAGQEQVIQYEVVHTKLQGPEEHRDTKGKAWLHALETQALKDLDDPASVSVSVSGDSGSDSDSDSDDDVL
ncbi:hypothetical protein HDU93_005491, partial [Gonapodya sp. JEL0774]